MQVLYFLLIIFQLFIALELIFPVISYILFLFASKNRGKSISRTDEADYAIIVTAYQQTGNLPNVVESLMKLHYSNYHIYLVADNCEKMNVDLNSDKVTVLYPPQVLSSNTRSHFYAINHFKRAHERLTIIDSDNLVDPEYLNELNKWFDKGYESVQGMRTAKNLDTVYACLDAANEMYYLFYDRKVLFGIGSSSMLTGSGMAFTVDLYKKCLGHLDIVGAGFDKILQKEILARGYRNAFAEGAIVYDEKTSRANQLVKQRARWNNTWFKFFPFGFTLMWRGIRKFDINPFLFGFVLLRPPLFILLIISGFLMIANIFIVPLHALIWFGLLVLFVIGFFWGLYKIKADKRIYAALIHVPKFMFFQVLSLLKVRKANQHSVATEHYHHHSIDEKKD